MSTLEKWERVRKIAESIENGEKIEEDLTGIGIVRGSREDTRIFFEGDFKFNEEAFKRSEYDLEKTGAGYIVSGPGYTIELFVDNGVIRPNDKYGETIIHYERSKLMCDCVVVKNNRPISRQVSRQFTHINETGFVCELPLE